MELSAHGTIVQSFSNILTLHSMPLKSVINMGLYLNLHFNGTAVFLE